MSIETDFNLIKWAWTLVMIPVTWIYAHTTITRKKVDEAQIEISKKLSREEVEGIIDRSLKPIHEKLTSIDNNVEYMRRAEK